MATLEDLAREAESLAAATDDAAAADAPGAPGAPAGPDAPADIGNYQAIGFIFTAARELLCKGMGLQSPAVTLNDAKVEALASVLAPVADKYGLQLGKFSAGPEGTALVIAGPILWAAAQALREELQARRSKPAAEPAPAPPPAAIVVPPDGQ